MVHEISQQRVCVRQISSELVSRASQRIQDCFEFFFAWHDVSFEWVIDHS